MRGFDDAAGARARMLKLVHVRLPPGFSSNTAAQRPSRVHTAHYNKGMHHKTKLSWKVKFDDISANNDSGRG